MIKRAFSDTAPLGSVAASLSLAALVLLPLALTRLPPQLPSAQVLASLLTLSVVCTAVAFLTYFSLIAEVGATRASLITYVNPCVAVVLGVLILGESVTPATLAGFALIVVGCWLRPRQAVARNATTKDPRQDGDQYVIHARYPRNRTLAAISMHKPLRNTEHIDTSRMPRHPKQTEPELQPARLELHFRARVQHNQLRGPKARLHHRVTR